MNLIVAFVFAFVAVASAIDVRHFNYLLNVDQKPVFAQSITNNDLLIQKYFPSLTRKPLTGSYGNTDMLTQYTNQQNQLYHQQIVDQYLSKLNLQIRQLNNFLNNHVTEYNNIRDVNILKAQLHHLITIRNILINDVETVYGRQLTNGDRIFNLKKHFYNQLLDLDQCTKINIMETLYEQQLTCDNICTLKKQYCNLLMGLNQYKGINDMDTIYEKKLTGGNVHDLELNFYNQLFGLNQYTGNRQIKYSYQNFKAIPQYVQQIIRQSRIVPLDKTDFITRNIQDFNAGRIYQQYQIPEVVYQNGQVLLIDTLNQIPKIIDTNNIHGIPEETIMQNLY